MVFTGTAAKTTDLLVVVALQVLRYVVLLLFALSLKLLRLAYTLYRLAFSTYSVNP
jgi:hypothetical protein